ADPPPRHPARVGGPEAAPADPRFLCADASRFDLVAPVGYPLAIDFHRPLPQPGNGPCAAARARRAGKDSTDRTGYSGRVGQTVSVGCNRRIRIAPGLRRPVSLDDPPIADLTLGSRHRRVAPDRRLGVVHALRPLPPRWAGPGVGVPPLEEWV